MSNSKLTNNNWQTKKLGDICDLQNGYAFKSKDYVENSDTMNFRMSQIRPDGSVNLYNNPKFLPDKYAETYKNFLLKDNDVVIAMTDLATETKILGVPTIVKTNGKNLLLNQRVGKLYNINEDLIYFPFLRYILTSPSVNKYYKSLGRGGLQINISKQQILNAVINFPSIPEQRRIVKILDEVFEKIEKAKENTEKNLQNSRELFDSYLNDVFSNPKNDVDSKPLGEVCDVIGGGTPPKSNLKYYSGGIYWATVRDMKFEIIKDTEHKITKDAVKNSSTNIIPKGNVVIATRVGLGKVCMVENDTAINQDLKGIVPFDSEKLLVGYLFQWLKSIAHIIKKEGTGATVQGVKLPFIKSLLIPIPKKAKQQEIVKNLDELSEQTKKLEEIYKKKLVDLEELKKSILNKAFSGRL